MKPSKLPLKGRGALSSPANRFDPYVYEDVDDGWPGDGEAAEALRTVLNIDKARSIINRNDSPDVPYEQSVNPYRGCEHGCIYCYARPSHAYYGFSPGLDFETQIVYKPDAARLLRKELGKRNYRCKPIALGSNTDIYQPAEKKLEITRQVLEVLHEFRHPVCLVTKSALIERDIDLLADMAEQNLVQVMGSITTLKSSLARMLEPRTAAPRRRLQTMQRLTDAGIPVGVLFAPIIPGLNDEELERVLAAARQAGADVACTVMLRLPREVKDLFAEWLSAHIPLKAERILNLVREVHDGKEYNSRFGVRMTGSGVYADLIMQRFRLACKRLGLDTRRRTLDCSRFRAPVPKGGQLSLFFSP
ncbi:MAG: PA0069 family radical SAM protein [Gammaproteobacteria bacterium]|nr:PA0069 family radical SAM protein [Gammaproteobacteria bacterium]